MTGRWHDVPLPGGAGWARVAAPALPTGRAVVLFHHRTGFDEFTHHAMARLTRAGLHVVAPDLFRGMPVDVSPDERKHALDDEDLVDRTRAAVRWSRETIGPEAPVALGFCMGGRVAYLAAAAGTGVRATVAFYGGDLDAGRGGPSPVARVRAGVVPVLLLRGSRDSAATAAQQQAAVDAADAVAGHLEALTFAGARHAFANPYTPERHHPGATARAWEVALDFVAWCYGTSGSGR